MSGPTRGWRRRIASSLPFVRTLVARIDRLRELLAAHGDNQAALALAIARLERRSDSASEPATARSGSRLCTARELDEPAYRAGCAALGERPYLHRKQWELVFVTRALAERGMLVPGRRGLGFGVGVEPLPALFAGRGAEVLATSLDAELAVERGWLSGQTISGRDALARPELCPPELFEQRVRYRAVDMTAIPADLQGFDFLWSACALEHLGSLALGSEFVQRSLACLGPGGIAVHTTELQLSHEADPVDHAQTVLFRRAEIERLVRALEADGHRVAPIDWDEGEGVLDRYADVPPYHREPHLRVWIDGRICTSIGLIVEKGAR
jgi:hypothetical protein